MGSYFAKVTIGYSWLSNQAVNAEDWIQFNKGSNPVPIETFAKYGRIDHLWVINPLKCQ